MWQIEITDTAEQAILSLDKPIRVRVIRFLRERVEPSEDPRLLAEPLSGIFQGLHRFRVGNYRIICEIKGVVCIVEVLDVAHRSRAYRKSGR